MEIPMLVFTIVGTVGAIIGGIVVYKGLDLRKPKSWLYGGFGFLCGLVAGLLVGNIIDGLKGGAMLAFAIMLGGATTRWHRQRYENREKNDRRE